MNILKSILQNMKNFNRAALAVFFGLLMLATVNASTHFNHLTESPTENNAVKPRAEFKQIWVDYDVEESGAKGMRIHVKFTTYEMKGLDSYLAVYFMDMENNKLLDKNGRMRSTTGEVAVYREMKPQYDPADYNDLSVFMPYAELDLAPGNYDLRMDVDLIYKAGGLIQHLTLKDFNYKKGGQSTDSDDEPEMENDGDSENVAKLNRIWIDYNVTQGGRQGMRIHVSFEVSGLKGSDIMLAIRILDKNDEFLKSKSPAYLNNLEQLEINYPLKPGFDTTSYEDASVFLPYEELIIGKGVWDLRFDIDLEYESHEFIQHLGFKEFEFKRQ